jgi:hypothetical protein
MMANARPRIWRGVAVHIYRANRDMERRAFFNADGELLIIPEQGRLELLTEMGRIDCGPGRGRAGAARRALPGAAAGRRGARLPRRKSRQPVYAFPISAPSARTGSPIRAISRRGGCP